MIVSETIITAVIRSDRSGYNPEGQPLQSVQNYPPKPKHSAEGLIELYGPEDRVVRHLITCLLRAGQGVSYGTLCPLAGLTEPIMNGGCYKVQLRASGGSSVP